MKKTICAVLALVLILAAAACLAEAVYERETVISGFEQLDAARHIVYAETWEYPLVDGQRGSGRPVAEDDGDIYTQPHHFAEDGLCADCNAENTAEAGTFRTASGLTLSQGAPAAEVLGQVLKAIPEGTEVALANVAPEQAEALLQAIKADDSAALAPLLKALPAEPVDGTDCAVLTLTYTDPDDWKVVETYAFAAADAAFFRLY